jgi:hypothetical protein
MLSLLRRGFGFVGRVGWTIFVTQLIRKLNFKGNTFCK